MVRSGGNLGEFIPPNVNLRVTARVHQGDLAQVLTDRGWTYQTAADFLGMTRLRFDNLINLRWDKLPKEFSSWFTREQEAKLFELTGKIPEDLWPEWLQERDLQRREVFVEMTPKMLAGGLKTDQLLLPEDIEKGLQRKELSVATEEMLATLAPREQEIIRAIFTDEFDVGGDEQRALLVACHRIAPQLGIPGKRIHQIACKALAKLRHPRRAGMVRQHLNLLDISKRR